MESEGVPVYRGIGVRRVQDLPMTPWKRLGGRGSYIQLYGTEGLWGMYVVEVPGAGALNVERHLYEKVVLVVEGRGSTEVWQEGQTKQHMFEWQKGSLFAIPLNAFHRFVNAASSPALLLCGTSAPNVMNLLDNPTSSSTVRTPSPSASPAPRISSSRTTTSSPIRSAGSPCGARISFPTSSTPSCRSTTAARPATAASSRRWPTTASMSGSASTRPAAIPRRTSTRRPPCSSASRARATPTRGRRRSARTPWKDGKADKVLRQDYEPVGLVSAAPMAGDWFHQHFGVGKEALRISAWHGPNNQRARKAGRPGEQLMDYGAIDLNKGGSAIPYHQEDPGDPQGVRGDARAARASRAG